ncbi:Fe(2+)-trafficking protein [Gammaproteobacteria bacterium SCGC AG-212-F23]|nr:Fe(2+)-trafficking protein [Gammaproteobacteria bacterium SCGC AG-212-F23]
MSRMIYCKKLKKESQALDIQPYPGALGEKILSEISKEAWQQWLNHQTMLINEYRLSMVDPKAREFLRKEMENFLFGDGSQKPAGYTPG